MADLITRGQVATQYVDLEGNPTSEVGFNPNNSTYAVEGVTSPDGRVLGKMGHTERVGEGLYKNVPGEFDMGLFTSAVQYFTPILVRATSTADPARAQPSPNTRALPTSPAHATNPAGPDAREP